MIRKPCHERHDRQRLVSAGLVERRRSAYLTVDHVRDHHDLVGQLVRELERRLGSFDIERHDDRLGTSDSLLQESDRDVARIGRDFVPESDSDV